MTPTNIIRIHERRTPLGDHPIWGGDLGGLLAQEEYSRIEDCCRYAVPDLSDGSAVMGAVMRLHASLTEREEGHREFLENVARQTVSEALGLKLDEIVATSEILESGSLGFVCDDEADDEQPATTVSGIEPWLRLRQSHSCIIQGTALNVQNRALVLARRSLQDLHPDYFDEALLFANLTLATHFWIPLDSVPWSAIPRAGRCRVDWDGEAPRLHAAADCFVVLIQELTKSVVELLFSWGLPNTLTRAQIEAVYRASDAEHLEPWYFMQGPAAAKRTQSALLAHGAVLQCAATPDPGRDLANTRTLLSLVPEGVLHGALPGLLSDDERLQRAAAKELGRSMREVERRLME
ncbi:hypothetical protein ACFL2T_00975 [Elusimicrobiota bacterium]